MTLSQLLECDRLTISPVLLRQDGQYSELLNALFSEPSVVICDELDSQLRELIELKNPSVEFDDNALTQAVGEHLLGEDSDDYGVWAYYPWLRKLVHLLPEDEFVECRTNRNKYKITQEEQDLLATKVVGVVGLSVGQSVSLTMAMERSFGELRIADFDDLELTNLNRIRSGVQNLGLPKTTIVAREIAEIDPFLKVTVFNEGLTEENIDQFLTEGKKMDLLIDECDGLYMKYHLRVKAKSLGIPVLMDTSDNGLIDIERYDLDPNYKYFHGLIDHLNFEEARGLKKNEDKVPFVLPIMGLETVSLEMKASMVEIDQSITTWPQLASSVVFGGGMTGDVSRRILLKEAVKSGRFFIDPITVIRSQKSLKPQDDTISDFKLFPEIVPTDDSVISKLISLAVLAPSSGNMQPWKFLWNGESNELVVVLEKNLKKSFGDYKNRASIVSIGCAVANIIEGLEQFGWKYRIDFSNNDQIGEELVTFKITDCPEPSKNLRFDWLSKRHTTRLLNCFDDIPKEKLESLKECAVANSNRGRLQIISDREFMDDLGEIIAQADMIRFLNLSCHEEFYREEVRWDDDEAKQAGDGLDMSKFYLNPSEYVGFKVAEDKSVIEKLNEWDVDGNAFGKLARKAVKASGAMGFVTVKSNSPVDFLNGGILVQNLWLKATELGLGFQPLSSPPYFFSRLIDGKGEGFTPKEKLKLEELYQKFSSLFSIEQSEGFVMLFRLVAKDDNLISYRKPLNDVLTRI